MLVLMIMIIITNIHFGIISLFGLRYNYSKWLHDKQKTN